MDNSFKNSELIDRYLNGLLNEDEQHQFEEQLAQDNELKSELDDQRDVEEGIRLFFEDELKAKLQSTEAEFKDGGQKFLWSRQSFYAIAASIALLIGCYYVFFQSTPNNDKTFYALYKPYPNVVEPVVRLMDNNSNLAMNYYESGDYENAILLLSESLLSDPNNDDYLFYLGQSYMASDNMELAYKTFNKMVTENNKYTAPTLWYLALINFRNGNNQQTKRHLNQLISDHSDYKVRAEGLLETLD